MGATKTSIRRASNSSTVRTSVAWLKLRVYVEKDRAGWSAGWTEWTQSYFTPPFARTDANKFSELPELENISNFRSEMRGWVDSVRSSAPVVAPVTDALSVARIIDACYRSEKELGASVQVAQGVTMDAEITS